MTILTHLRGTLLWLLLALLVGAIAAAGWGWREYGAFRDRPLELAEQRVIEVEPGDSFRVFLQRLRAAGVTDGRDILWQLLARELDVLTRLQVGEYALEEGVSARQLLLQIGKGEVIQHRFTIVEGWNFRQLREALASNEALEQTLVGVSDAQIMEQLGQPGQHPEGRFLPETYKFTRRTPDVELLRRSHQAMEETLASVWVSRVADLPLDTAEQALILASIIEKETGLASERREIAGVFIRRLRLGMKLQTDPTVIYGIGAEFDGNLTRAHLGTDTPWNTYVRIGLPVTPIALPGVAALQAAVDPAPGQALYFVARGDGSHQFSSTLAEHNRAVRRFQLGFK